MQAKESSLLQGCVRTCSALAGAGNRTCNTLGITAPSAEFSAANVIQEVLCERRLEVMELQRGEVSGLEVVQRELALDET